MFTFLIIFAGKIGMKDQAYMKKLEDTVACAIRAGKSTMQDKKAATPLEGNACFSSACAEVVAAKIE